MRTVAALAVVLVAASPLAAQRTWLDPLPARTIGLVTTLAAFDDRVTASPVATFAVRGRHGLGDAVAVGFELPFAHARQANGLSGWAIGNPWVGIEMAATASVTVEFGARINLWSPDTQRGLLPWPYGQVLDFDRWEAWFVRSSSVRAVAHLGVAPPAGPFATARLGVTGFSVGGGGGDGELFLDYGARAGLASSGWLGWLGLLGHGLVTEAEGSLADRTTHQLELAATTRGDEVRLEVGLRRYLGESFGSSVPLIARLGATVTL